MILYSRETLEGRNRKPRKNPMLGDCYNMRFHTVRSVRLPMMRIISSPCKIVQRLIEGSRLEPDNLCSNRPPNYETKELRALIFLK
jgi:hypothetical protein